MNLDEFWANAFWSLAPSVGIGLMFWLVIRAVIRADRGERRAYARMEAKMRAEMAAKRRQNQAAMQKASDPDG